MALPLIIALFSAVQILDGLVQQSAVAVFRSVNRIESSRKLVDLLHSQERSARLYNVLGEPVHLSDVNTIFNEIDATIQQFTTFNTEEEIAPLIELLQAKVGYLVAVLNKASGDPERQRRVKEGALAGYSEIGKLANQLEKLCNSLMSKEVDALKEMAHSNKKTLVWQVSGLIGFSVLLVILFISLIVKPVHQLDRSIERLGEGDFSTPIQLAGPRDLEAIGDKLDWLRRRLDTLDREKVKMLAHISHELKTPLSSIKEGAGLLKDGLVGPLSQSQEEVVTILDSNCSKLQKLIQNILDFNMAQARETPIILNDFQLDELVNEVIADHRNAMMARNINIVTRLTPSIISGDRKQLKTVIDNLLGNAVKFVQDDGEIGIYMKLKGKKINILVEDNGPGVSEEDRPQIFQPFFQGGQKNRSVIKGSGLGLAISKEYVQNCGGTLRLLPSSQGARFSLTVPRAQGDAA